MLSKAGPLTCNRIAECVGGDGYSAREDAGRDARVSRSVVPGGERAGVSAWRAVWPIDGQTVEYLDAVRHTQWFNTLGAPAAVVPVGRSPEGLPIGVQIVARPFEDEMALGVAAVVDGAFGYRAPGICR